MSFQITNFQSLLLDNVSVIYSMDSTLRTLAWLLPGKFRDAELASEAVSASFNVLSLYLDKLLTKAIHNDPDWKPTTPLSPHTRYTLSWLNTDRLYEWTSRTLEFIRFTQLLIEMGLRRKAPQYKLRGILLIELVKFVLRLVLLNITKRPLLLPSVPERQFHPSDIPPTATISRPIVDIVPHAPKYTLNLDQNPIMRELTTSFIKPPPYLLRKLASYQDFISEMLFLVRPLVYAITISYTRHSASERALLISIAMDWASRWMRRTPPPFALLERAEYARRDRDLCWYLLRGDIWQSYTRSKLEGFARGMEVVPILGIIGSSLKDWIPLIDEYHYYTAL